MLFYVHLGLCLNCVQCNSFVNKTCDTDPKIHSQPCADVNTTACRKMEQEGNVG